MKKCSRCKVSKELTEFRKGKGYADGHAGQCKACLLEIRQARNADPAVREKRRAHDREYKQRPEVKQRVREYMQRPDVNEYVKERERKRWQNDEELRKYKRDYLRKRYHENEDHRRKQKEYSMAALHRRRARLAKNGGSYTAQQWRDLQAKYDHKCLRCGEAKLLTPDHIVPIEKGGSGDISNIQPLCLPCNLWKHTKIIDFRPVE